MDIALHIIAVDDTAMNLVVLEEMGKDIGYEILCFDEPLIALEHIQKHRVDMMFVDYMMPEMNGIELIQAAKVIQPDMIAVMITAVNDDEKLKIQALEDGATDFLTKPLNIAEFQAKLKNLSEMKRMQRSLSHFNDTLQQRVEEATKALIDREHETLRVLSNTAEYKDAETANHIARVSHYSRLLGEKAGLSDEEMQIIFYASPLHDIGKVGISDSVLLKPGKLSDEEFEQMKQHTIIGAEILKNSKNPYLQAGEIIARTHHERYDGRGYPEGLKGDAIPVMGRITAIADVFDALTSTRPYKKAWEFDEAVAFLRDHSGTHFDPTLVTKFIENLDEVRAIFERFQNSSS